MTTTVFQQNRFKRLLVAVFFSLSAFVLTGCTNTKLSQVWSDPEFGKSFENILVIGIGKSEQNRRAYESHFVTELEANGIKAVASYKLIKSDVKIDRNSVKKAIDGLNIDGVIVTHVAAVDEETFIVLPCNIRLSIAVVTMAVYTAIIRMSTPTLPAPATTPHTALTHWRPTSTMLKQRSWYGPAEVAALHLNLLMRSSLI